MIRLQLILLLVLLLTISFKTEAQKVISDEQYQISKHNFPQRPKSKFKFSKKRYVNKMKNKNILEIDTDAVYITKFYYSQIKDTAYSYSRCFITGELFVSGPYLTEPTEVQCNDLTYGDWTMYTINNGTIIQETPATSDFVRWYYDYGRIEVDEIIWYKTHLGRLITNSNVWMNFVWHKKKVHLYNYKINWN